MKIPRVIFSFVIAASGMMLASCSEDVPEIASPEEQSEEQPQPEAITYFEPCSVDLSFLKECIADKTDATFGLKDFSVYHKDELSQGKWELQKDLIGAWATTPSTIIIKNGKLLQIECGLDYSDGRPSDFTRALAAINTKLKTKYSPYSVCNFSIDAENGTMALNGRIYNIVGAANDSFMLGFTGEFKGGRTHNGGRFLDVTTYELCDPIDFNDGSHIAFESTAEAYDWLIALFSKTFGTMVNLNNLYAPNIIYDNPYFYLSELENEKKIAVD